MAQFFAYVTFYDGDPRFLNLEAEDENAARKAIEAFVEEGQYFDPDSESKIVSIDLYEVATVTEIDLDALRGVFRARAEAQERAATEAWELEQLARLKAKYPGR